MQHKFYPSQDYGIPSVRSHHSVQNNSNVMSLHHRTVNDVSIRVNYSTNDNV